MNNFINATSAGHQSASILTRRGPRKLRTAVLLALASLAVAVESPAATIWTGGVDSNISDSGNWNDGLPTSAGNPGTIGASGPSVLIDVVPLTGYHIIQNANTVSGDTSTRIDLFGGNYTINGGTFTVDQLGLQNGSGVADGNQIFTLNGGTVSTQTTTTTGLTVGVSASRTATMFVTDGSFTTRNAIVSPGGTLNISGGTFSTTITGSASGLRVNGGAVLVSGGTMTLASEIRNAGSLTFTGGTTTTTRLRGDSGFSMTLGGTTAGSFTAGDVTGSANFAIDWLSGSLMTMRFTSLSLANWAETEWTAERMFFDGQTGADLGLTWAQVSNPAVGFNDGGGTYFDWDGSTSTLALVTVPEPASLAAVGIVGLLVLAHVRRQRRKVRSVEA